MGRDEELEECVAEFLERREHEPGLEPEAHAARHPALAPELLSRLRAALEVQSLLSAGGLGQPERFGPYRVVSRLGQGGMGVVFEVERDGRRYALKALALELTGTSRALERFQREARALERLAHPGIVRIHEIGVFQGSPYLVLDRVQGRALSTLHLPLAPERAARIVLALARAVAAAHAAGVLHRDLKPSNVILRDDDAPVLLDFGLGTAADEPTLTSSGVLVGTPRYMAPEQALGTATDARTDVHGLGLILYELLFGAPARPEGSRAEVLERARRGRLEVPPAPSVPPELVRLVRAALAREPRRRPPSAATLAEELERFLAGQPLRVRPPRLDQRLLDQARHHPVRVLLAAAALVAGLALARALVARPETERWLAQAQELGERARAALGRGASEEAVELALDSVERFAAAGGDATVELPRLLGLAEARPETIAALERRVAAGDERALVAFALAYAHDSAHALDSAARAYGRALVLDPTLLRAHLNLAHLHAGAQLGACLACDQAYAAAPEVLAPELALQHLRQALDLDRGESEACVGRVVQTALALGARVPASHARAAIAGALAELLEQGALSPGARRRVEEGLGRLRAAGGG